MNRSASLLVIIATLLNVAALMYLLFRMRRRRGESSVTTETTGHVWDDDLRELNNPMPRWWLGLFVLSVIFGLGYLVIYPGLGNYGGISGWSSVRQWQEQSAQAEAVLAKTFAAFAGRSADDLARDPAALRIGRNLFVNNCAPCHGTDARGALGFPNLTDRDWLYGGSAESIVKSISYGRSGVMPAWRDALGGDAGVEDVLKYVLSLSGRELPGGDLQNGKAKFAAICAACHGSDGKGNQAIGAPNLTDQTWLYGGSAAAVRQTIAYGRHGQMPAQLERLGPTRINLLAAYIINLGGGDSSGGGTAPVNTAAAPGPAVAAATPTAAALRPK